MDSVELERGAGTAMLAGALTVLESFTASFAADAVMLGKAELLERTDLLERASRVLQHGRPRTAFKLHRIHNHDATGPQPATSETNPAKCTHPDQPAPVEEKSRRSGPKIGPKGPAGKPKMWKH